uniref:PHF7/G2E3-like PHD zinc finger domain-containing protein n=1 Tax=Strix occidentalis caurina TaxID=311401 RepID=A0A8D0KRK2_STROC
FEGKARVDRHPRWKALTEESVKQRQLTCSFPLAFALSPPVCVLCGWSAADPDLCGQKIELEEFCAHLFCVVSAPGLPPARVLGFLPEDIHRTVVRAAQKAHGSTRARYAGFAFNCPLCRNEQEFLQDMLTMGIQIPLRLVSRWLTGQEAANEALTERHSRCDARECLCPGGREQAEEHGPWELLLCSSCAAEGTHRHCSNLGTSRTSWECESCATSGPDALQLAQKTSGEEPRASTKC